MNSPKIRRTADYCGGGLVDGQRVQSFAVSRFGRVRVRASVGKPVPVRWASAEEPALELSLAAIADGP